MDFQASQPGPRDSPGATPLSHRPRLLSALLSILLECCCLVELCLWTMVIPLACLDGECMCVLKPLAFAWQKFDFLYKRKESHQLFNSLLPLALSARGMRPLEGCSRGRASIRLKNDCPYISTLGRVFPCSFLTLFFHGYYSYSSMEFQIHLQIRFNCMYS